MDREDREPPSPASWRDVATAWLFVALLGVLALVHEITEGM